MLKALLGTMLVGLTLNAHAELVDFRHDSDNFLKPSNLAIDNQKQEIWLGKYNFLENNSTKLVGFCVDPFQPYSSQDKVYDKSSLDASDFLAGNGASRLMNVQKLFDNAYDSLGSDLNKTAGFHLALWEIFNDNQILSNGRVNTVNDSDADIVGAANIFLSSLGGWNVTNDFDLTFYGNDTYQDFLVAKKKPKPVPLPAALPLFAVAIAGLGFKRRRNV